MGFQHAGKNIFWTGENNILSIENKFLTNKSESLLVNFLNFCISENKFLIHENKFSTFVRNDPPYIFKSHLSLQIKKQQFEYQISDCHFTLNENESSCKASSPCDKQTLASVN